MMTHHSNNNGRQRFGETIVMKILIIFLLLDAAVAGDGPNSVWERKKENVENTDGEPKAGPNGRVSFGTVFNPHSCAPSIHFLVWIFVSYVGVLTIRGLILFLTNRAAKKKMNNVQAEEEGHYLHSRSCLEWLTIHLSWITRQNKQGQHLKISTRLRAAEGIAGLHVWLGILFPFHPDTAMIQLTIGLVHTLALCVVGCLFYNEFGVVFSSDSSRAGLLGLFAAMVATMTQPLSHVPYMSCNTDDKRLESLRRDISNKRSRLMEEWQAQQPVATAPTNTTTEAATDPYHGGPDGGDHEAAAASATNNGSSSVVVAAHDDDGGRVHSTSGNGGTQPDGDVAANGADGQEERSLRLDGINSHSNISFMHNQPSPTNLGTGGTEGRRRVTFHASPTTESPRQYVVEGNDAGPPTTTSPAPAPPSPQSNSSNIDPLSTHVIVDTFKSRLIGHVLNVVLVIAFTTWIFSATSHWCTAHFEDFKTILVASLLYDAFLMQPGFCGLVALSQYMREDENDGVEHSSTCNDSEDGRHVVAHEDRGVKVISETGIDGAVRSVWRGEVDGSFNCYPITGELRYVGRLRFTADVIASHRQMLDDESSATVVVMRDESVASGGTSRLGGNSSVTTANSHRVPLHQQSGRVPVLLAARAAAREAVIDPEFWRSSNSSNNNAVAAVSDGQEMEFRSPPLSNNGRSATVEIDSTINEADAYGAPPQVEQSNAPSAFDPVAIQPQ